MTRTGVTLIEVAVALVVLQLATLGALSTLRQAVRVRIAAERVEARSHAMELVADSLRVAFVPSDGSRVVGPDTVHWSVDDLGDVTIRGRGSEWRDSLFVRREAWGIDG